MTTNKFPKHLTLKLLALTLTFFISTIIVPAFNSAFATRVDAGVLITEGELHSSTYEMKVYGYDFSAHEAHDGDWYVSRSGTSVTLSDAYVEYDFRVPETMYEKELITKITVKVEYNNVDFADMDGGNDNGPPELQVYRWNQDSWYTWKTFPDAGGMNIPGWRTAALISTRRIRTNT